MIYVVGMSYVVCRMSVVCQINCVGGITWPTRMLKVFWGRLTGVIHCLYARALAWWKKKLKIKRSLRNEKLKADRTSETEEQRKESLRIRREKDRARRRTKGKKRSPDTDDYEKQRLATLKRLKRGEVDLRLEKVVTSKQLRLAVETEEKKNKTGSFSEKLAAMVIIQI